jgi:hypothetical protein
MDIEQDHLALAAVDAPLEADKEADVGAWYSDSRWGVPISPAVPSGNSQVITNTPSASWVMI